MFPDYLASLLTFSERSLRAPRLRTAALPPPPLSTPPLGPLPLPVPLPPAPRSLYMKRATVIHSTGMKSKIWKKKMECFSSGYLLKFKGYHT